MSGEKRTGTGVPTVDAGVAGHRPPSRRALFLLPLLGACSVLPDRPYQENTRYPLAPARPAGPARAPTGQALLLRTLRAAPGLESRGLRRLRPDGTVEVLPYDEWIAPPGDLAEAALRDWLLRSRLFTAVTAPGSRLTANVVLEAELTRLDTDGRTARAGLAALLLREGGGRVVAQRAFTAEAPVEGEGAAAAARAMEAAAGRLLAEVEGWLASSLGGGAARVAASRR